MSNGKSSVRPDLTETLIILLISAAITMFLFWIASVYLWQDKFRSVPEIFKNIWASVATGAVGVASAIAKSFTTKRKDHPNYLVYIGFTTLLMLTPIAAIIYAGEHQGSANPSRPIGSHLITTDGRKVEFQLGDAVPIPALTIALRGSYKVEGQELKGHLASGSIKTNDAPNAPVHVGKLVFRSCSLNEVGSYVSFYPPQPTSTGTIDVDLKIAPGVKLDVPPGDFSFPLPNVSLLSRSWLCATLYEDSGFPHQLQ